MRLLPLINWEGDLKSFYVKVLNLDDSISEPNFNFDILFYFSISFNFFFLSISYYSLTSTIPKNDPDTRFKIYGTRIFFY